MSLRSSTIYVEPRTVKRLGLVQKLYPQRIEGADAYGIPREKTRDEIGDELINHGIAERYPRVFELEKALAKVEREFIQTK